ncbi:hypothetical protein BDZ91DRAFT_807668 [Kalaharituber pfeilii]|nr:hypothetical protein BDZ91DRAFT_807668 [Kalaharituber pfeilii]
MTALSEQVNQIDSLKQIFNNITDEMTKMKATSQDISDLVSKIDEVSAHVREIKSGVQSLVDEDCNLSRNNTLKTDSIFIASDKLKYGDFVPAICGPGDIRISRPEIIHGSASNKAGKEVRLRGRWLKACPYEAERRRR